MNGLRQQFVLLHGFTGSPESWEPVAAQLKANGAQGLCPTLVGHDRESGLSYSANDGEDNGFATEVDRLAALVTQQQFAGAHLAGYSLGGRVACVLLSRHPQLFSQATLIGCHPGLDAPRQRAERKQADQHWQDLLLNEGLDAFVDKWESLPLFNSQSRLSEIQLKNQRAARLRCDPKGLAFSLGVTGLGVMPSTTSALEALEMPIHLVSGKLDSKFTGLLSTLLSRLKHARHSVLPDIGHNPVLEAPDRITACLLSEPDEP